MSEIISIIDYKDSDRFKELKSLVWKQAAGGQPFSIREQSANEYRYFHRLYELSKRVAAKEITNEEAAKINQENYRKFEFDQRLWEMYKFSTVEWNENIKRSEALRVEFARCTDAAEGYRILAEIVSRLTGDKTVKTDAQLKWEVSGYESTQPKDP